jgi:predicted transcriptional regulator of viral defense system
LERSGVVRRIATGYYVIVPQDRLGDHRWRPELDATTLGIAQADYGSSAVALMGTSAARHHGAIPRAIAVAVIAVPNQRPALETAFGRVIFVKRDVERLDVERIDTQLASGWVTTVEQTLLDLAARPTLGGLPEADVAEAIRILADAADWANVEQLAREQHRPAALRTAHRLTGNHRARS